MKTSRLVTLVVLVALLAGVYLLYSNQQEKSAKADAYRKELATRLVAVQPGWRIGGGSHRYSDAELTGMKVTLEQAAVALTAAPPEDAAAEAQQLAAALRTEVQVIEYFRVNINVLDEALGSSDPRWIHLRSMKDPAVKQFRDSINQLEAKEYATFDQTVMGLD